MEAVLVTTADGKRANETAGSHARWGARSVARGWEWRWLAVVPTILEAILMGVMLLPATLLPATLRAAGPTRVSGAEPPSATLPIHLASPMRWRWRVADGKQAHGSQAHGKQAEGTLALPDLRLELRLGPRGIPKCRFVGSTILKAERDTTWIEFMGSRLDQVLKLRVDCRADDEVELVITPYVQANAGAGLIRYTEAVERRLKLQAELVARRSEYQMRMLGAAPGGKDGQTIFLSSAKLTPSGERTRLMADYHYKEAREAQERLWQLDILREKLEGTARLEVRATRADDARPVQLLVDEQGG